MHKLHIQSLSNGKFRRDELLLHAAFQVLVDFVEKERPARFRYRDPGEKAKWNEVRALYKWWTKTRPSRKDPLSLLPRPSRATVRRVLAPLKETTALAETKTYVAVGSLAHTPAQERAFRRSAKLEAEYLDEDQAMLRRLVEVRLWLWT